jgi:hypothetical protein
MKSPWTWVAVAIVWLLLAPSWWNTLQDPDLWWQLWAGEELLAGHYPRTNALSWTAPDQRWVSHEPLVALAYAAGGVEWVGWLRGLVLSATGVLLARMVWHPQAGWAAVLALLWVTPLMQSSVLERALAWGNLLLAAVTALLFVSRWPRRFPAAAALVALWSVVHGSFVLGLGMLALFSPAWAGLAAAATLLLPDGLDRWGLVLGYGTGQGPQALVHLYVAEWRPLVPPADGFGWVLLAGVLFGLYAAWTAPADTPLARWRARLIALGVTALAFKHLRYSANAGIVLLPFVATRLASWTPPRAFGRADRVLAGAFALTAAVCAATRGAPRPDPLLWPAEILAPIPHEPGTWSDFTLGAWHAREGIPAFWDSRNDCYPESVLVQGLEIAVQAEGWEALLQQHDIQRVLTRDPQLVQALQGLSWQISEQAGLLYLVSRPD